MKISILMPVHNERYLIGECLRRVLAAPLPQGLEREIIIVDDGSTDGTDRILRDARDAHPAVITLLRHEKNQGKGAAVRSAIALASGEIFIIQDGDLEYDPGDYRALLEPILAGDADAVFGSRFSGQKRRVLDFWHTKSNRTLTFLSNMFTGLDLTDMWTCYKAVLAPFAKGMPLRCDGVCLEPELTAKLAKRRCRIYEVPITYHGRGEDDGKSLGWSEALRSLGVMAFFWLVDDLYGDDRWGQKILHQLDKATNFNNWMADAVRPSLGDRVLEIGAGIGNLSAKLCRRDAYYASDNDEPYCRHLERRFAGRPSVKVVRLDITRAADFAPLKQTVDTVVCLNVLEHIEDDRAALRSLLTTLTPQGRLVLLVPNLPWAYGSIDRLAEHKRRYTRAGLAALLVEAGFSAPEISDFNRISLPAWVWNGKFLKRETFGRVQLKLFDSLVWLFRRIDHLLPWPGQSLIAVAQKER